MISPFTVVIYVAPMSDMSKTRGQTKNNHPYLPRRVTRVSLLVWKYIVKIICFQETFLQPFFFDEKTGSIPMVRLSKTSGITRASITWLKHTPMATIFKRTPQNTCSNQKFQPDHGKCWPQICSIRTYIYFSVTVTLNPQFTLSVSPIIYFQNKTYLIKS